MKTIAHHRLMPDQFLSSGLPPGSSPPSFIAKYDITCCGISLWWVGASCPSYVPCQLLVRAQSPCWWDEKQKGTWLCKDWSAIRKTSLHYQHLPAQIKENFFFFYIFSGTKNQNVSVKSAAVRKESLPTSQSITMIILNAGAVEMGFYLILKSYRLRD